jgi:pyruvate formate lyase activating enzyme
VDPSLFGGSISEADVFAFLQSRVSRLEGVVVSGGEPTIHQDLPVLLRRIKKLKLAIKLDTNGSSPEMIEGLIGEGLLDYIAIDIKTSPDLYAKAAGTTVDTGAIRRSVESVISSGLSHELRMTFVEPLLPLETMAGVAELARGCQVFLVQPFQPSKTLDHWFLRLERPSAQRLEQVCCMLQEMGLPAAVR